jgi:hypothetical protein
MSPDQQFEAIGKAIGSIQDPALKSSIASDIFGRSGKELIAVFNDFDGSIGTAKSELGGMVGVMNTSAATFDTISDNIAVARGKFMEFAAGILSNITPALEAITEGLKRIDAAKIGSDLINAFLGGTKAMEGFQTAVSAIKAGNISEAFKLAFTSISFRRPPVFTETSVQMPSNSEDSSSSLNFSFVVDAKGFCIVSGFVGATFTDF